MRTGSIEEDMSWLVELHGDMYIGCNTNTMNRIYNIAKN